MWDAAASTKIWKMIYSKKMLEYTLEGRLFNLHIFIAMIIILIITFLVITVTAVIIIMIVIISTIIVMSQKLSLPSCLRTYANDFKVCRESYVVCADKVSQDSIECFALSLISFYPFFHTLSAS